MYHTAEKAQEDPGVHFGAAIHCYVWNFICFRYTHIHKGEGMETWQKGEKEGGRSNKIPAPVINGVGLDFMNLTLPVTWTIDHLQCHPGNRQLGHTLYKWGRACVPRSSIWITDSSQRREQHIENLCFLSITSPSFPTPPSLLYPRSLSLVNGSEVTALKMKVYVHLCQDTFK